MGVAEGPTGLVKAGGQLKVNGGGGGGGGGVIELDGESNNLAQRGGGCRRGLEAGRNG